MSTLTTSLVVVHHRCQLCHRYRCLVAIQLLALAMRALLVLSIRCHEALRLDRFNDRWVQYYQTATISTVSTTTTTMQINCMHWVRQRRRWLRSRHHRRHSIQRTTHRHILLLRRSIMPIMLHRKQQLHRIKCRPHHRQHRRWRIQVKKLNGRVVSTDIDLLFIRLI